MTIRLIYYFSGPGQTWLVKLKTLWPLCLYTMTDIRGASGWSKHMDRFGMCECGPFRSGIETMRLEFEVRPGWYKHKDVPACADCFGLL